MDSLTYPDLAKKMHHLTMAPSDWKALNALVCSHNYQRFVNAYKAREAKTLPKCTAVFKTCKCCKVGTSMCTFNGFCSQQDA